MRRYRKADDDADDLISPDRFRSTKRGWGSLSDGAAVTDGGSTFYAEVHVKFDELPKAVREAVMEECPGAGNFTASLVEYGNLKCYSVQARRGRVEMSLTLSMAGEVLEYEVEITPSRLPKAIRDVLEREFSEAEFDWAGAVHLRFFELHYEDRDGKRHILQIDASGRIISDNLEDEEDGEDLSV